MELSVSEFLAIAELEGVHLVAGHGGVDRAIVRTNIMDNPDTFDWLMPGELLLSTGYIFQGDEALQMRIIQGLSELNCAGLCIKTERYLKQIPACMIREANRLDFPLIELPFGYSLSATANIINRRLFSQQDHQLEKTLAIHREIMQTALAAGSLYNLTETLVRLIGNPVLVTDSQWNLLCHVDRPDNPLPLKLFANTMGKQPPFPEEFLSTLPVGLRHYKKIVTRIYPTDGHGSVPCHILPIAAHNFIYGYLIVWETVRHLTELDYAALEQAAVAAALERIRTKEVEETKLRGRKDFLDDLLSGNIESLNAIRSLSKAHGLEFDRWYRCLVVYNRQEAADSDAQSDMDQSSLQQNMVRMSTAAAKAFRETGVNIITIPKGMQLVILAELGRTPEEKTPALRKAAQDIAQQLSSNGAGHSALIAAGKAVSTVSDVNKSFQDALRGLHMAQTSKLREQVVFMDDFAVYQLLSEHVSKSALRRFRQSSIGPLLRHDEKNGTQFVETLEKYFQTNCSISDAAKEMYIHRNTYIYRLEKIKTLLGVDLKNAQKLQELQLGLLAHRILEE